MGATDIIHLYVHYQTIDFGFKTRGALLMSIFGADYYPEHWDTDKWPEHVRLMKQFGIEWVRIGEFAWAIVEPDEGKYDFSLLDKAIELLKKNGIKIILGTPTATPPIWLVNKYPEILPVDKYGRVRNFGSRRHYCFSSKVYRQYSQKIVEEYAKRYGQVVDAWQIDNEFGCHDTSFCYCENCRKKFIEWLKTKYKTVEELNYRWGNRFWSQMLRNWDDFVFPINTPTFENPHMLLDYMRFCTDNIVEYQNMQLENIRKYSSAPITHNFMGDFFDIDYKKLAKNLDFVSWDNYMGMDHYRAAANHDLMRSLKKKPFLVIEQQSGRVNWLASNEQYSKGYIELWIKQAYLHGSMGSLLFRFDQIGWGAEQYLGAMLDYAGRPTHRCEDFKRAKETIHDQIDPVKEVAIYFDYENVWIHRINHINQSFRYWNSLLEIYKAVRKLGYNVDFVFEDDDIGDYQLLIVPYASKLGGFTQKIKYFSKPVIMTCMSGIKNDYNWLCEEMPNDLTDCFGLEVLDFGGNETSEIFFDGEKFVGRHWCDRVAVREAEVLAVFTSGPFIGEAAVCKKGEKYYIASVFDERFFAKMLTNFLKPRFASDDIEICRTKSGFKVLNLKNSFNDFWIANKKIVLNPFEVRDI